MAKTLRVDPFVTAVTVNEKLLVNDKDVNVEVTLHTPKISQTLDRQLKDGYSSRKRKGPPASFQAKKCVVLDDVRIASVGTHLPKKVSNYRRCRIGSRKGQEEDPFICAEWVVPLNIATCFSFLMANNFLYDIEWFLRKYSTHP
ncbi:hypothetical protein TNCV_3094431 [Trichonephila clavipes]|nr:hypothetical protein TNCV_3094431 [Trichonephila clavipes]